MDMTTYTVEETAQKIGKSTQTVRAYVKRGILDIAPDDCSAFKITEDSIASLPSKLGQAMQGLRRKRSENMKNKWNLIKAA